jgi:hypothetical protein
MPSAIRVVSQLKDQDDVVALLTAGNDGKALVYDHDTTSFGMGALGMGAPSDAEYITSAASASLSAEVTIPGLAGHADIAGAGGAGTSEEFDTSTTGLTWSPSDPNTVNSDTTIKSHLYIISTDNTTRTGTKDWTPGSGAFDARAKIYFGCEVLTNAREIHLYIANSDDTTYLRVGLGFNQGVSQQALTINAYTRVPSSETQRGANWSVPTTCAYFRITRDGSNNIAFYWSTSGLVWQYIGGTAITFTVAKIGFRLSNGESNTFSAAVDWLRTSV